VAANPQGTVAFAAGANEAVSNVVESTVIVEVSPPAPLLVRKGAAEASDASRARLTPAASTAAMPTPAAIGLMALYIRTSIYSSRLASINDCCLICGDFNRRTPNTTGHERPRYPRLRNL